MAVGKNTLPVMYAVVADGMDATKLGEDSAVLCQRGCSLRRRQRGLLKRGGSKDLPNLRRRPALTTAVDNAVGNVAVSDIMIIAKNMAWLMVCPQFCRVARILRRRRGVQEEPNSLWMPCWVRRRCLALHP